MIVTCQPHAAVRLAGRVWLLRFLYPVSAAASPKAAAEFEVLRRATGERGRPGLLHGISGRILEPASPRDLGGFLSAEADQYTRLWRRYGGRPDDPECALLCDRANACHQIRTAGSVAH
jgi:hypothetical protein